MLPDTAQKQWLRDYLYAVMRYRETFEEVYDHILLALEDEPEPEFFERAVMHIIDRDFGTYGFPVRSVNSIVLSGKKTICQGTFTFNQCIYFVARCFERFYDTIIPIANYKCSNKIATTQTTGENFKAFIPKIIALQSN